MTLEDKLLDRLVVMAQTIQRQDIYTVEIGIERARLNKELAVKSQIIKDLEVRLAQVESAHTQLLKYTKELESKLSRKGKRGK
jgi:hypothetical protein